jgi:hypothetical protein
VDNVVEVCNRLISEGGVNPARVERDIEAFESDPSLDSLVALAQAIVEAGGTLRGFVGPERQYRSNTRCS